MICELPGYHKLICVTDGGMCMYPDFEQKKQIVMNAVQFFNKLGYEKPAVAALCAIETVNPKMPETVHAAELHRMSVEGELGNCYVEGPISYDLAMVPELMEVKGYKSDYSGNFDILFVPEIVAGNVGQGVRIYLRRKAVGACIRLQGAYRFNLKRFIN